MTYQTRNSYPVNEHNIQIIYEINKQIIGGFKDIEKGKSIDEIIKNEKEIAYDFVLNEKDLAEKRINEIYNVNQVIKGCLDLLEVKDEKVLKLLRDGNDIETIYSILKSSKKLDEALTPKERMHKKEEISPKKHLTLSYA